MVSILGGIEEARKDGRQTGTGGSFARSRPD
jgi:hypothetical protein